MILLFKILSNMKQRQEIFSSAVSWHSTDTTESDHETVKNKADLKVQTVNNNNNETYKIAHVQNKSQRFSWKLKKELRAEHF